MASGIARKWDPLKFHSDGISEEILFMTSYRNHFWAIKCFEIHSPFWPNHWCCKSWRQATEYAMITIWVIFLYDFSSNLYIMMNLQKVAGTVLMICSQKWFMQVLLEARVSLKIVWGQLRSLEVQIHPLSVQYNFLSCSKVTKNIMFHGPSLSQVGIKPLYNASGPSDLTVWKSDKKILE